MTDDDDTMNEKEVHGKKNKGTTTYDDDDTK